MRTRKYLFRVTTALAVGGLLLGPGLAPFARAQPAGQAEPAGAGGDPPARVGRLARVTGTVSFHTADQTQWDAATINYPVTSGNSFWTEPRATAVIEVGPTRLAMDQSTELDVDTLDDHVLTGTLPQGEVFLNVQDVEAGDSYQIRTPRGLVTIAQPGRYEVTAGDTEHPTTVTVVAGLAQITGDNLSVDVRPGQTAQVTGTDMFQATVGAGINDPFLTGFLAPPPASPRPVAYAPPQMVVEMTGGDALEETGAWEPSPDYGEVWYPPVSADWVPYREGHWAYVSPWGWTWVDDASWGFAPFHYGRWVQVGPRWGWIPAAPGIALGRGAGYGRPVYSPALVSFVGLGAGVAVGAAIGAAVGWIPLGPREAYRPPYRVSDTYLRRVNVTNVTNVNTVTSITNNVTINNFANRRGATVVPAAAMVSSQPIARQARQITPQGFAAARPVASVPVRPTVATAGITPNVARQLNIVPGAGGLPVRPASPGPALQGRPEGGRPGPVALRPPGGIPSTPNAGGPGEAGRPEGGRPRMGAVIGDGAFGGAVAGMLSRSAPNAAPPATQGAPGPAIRAPGSPVAAPNAIRPAAPLTAPQPGEAARPGAPGPGFVPRPAVAAPGGLPSLRPTAPPTAVAPPAPRPVPPAVVNHEPPQGFTPQPRPAPIAPAPHIVQPVAPRPAPPPAPRPEAPRFTPPPRPAPPPQQHFAPPPQEHFAPPPRPAPQPQHAPPPQQHEERRRPGG